MYKDETEFTELRPFSVDEMEEYLYNTENIKFEEIECTKLY